MNPGSWVVVFVSRRSGADAEGYGAMAEQMEQLARAQPGFVGMHSVRGEDGVGITVCYWQSAEAIAAWKRDVGHAAAQRVQSDSPMTKARAPLTRAISCGPSDPRR